MNLEPKKLFFEEFSKTLRGRELHYYSFFNNITAIEELELLFTQMTADYGKKHIPVYRMCDAEYIYCFGVRIPRAPMKLRSKITLTIRGLLIRLNLMNQRTWHGENYSAAEKRRLKRKYLDDLRQIGEEGYLAPHLMLSEAKFCEEYNDDMVSFYHKHHIPFNEKKYFPFYFVYVILSLKRFKEVLFKGKNVLVVTSLNERKQMISFEAEFAKEGVANVYYYDISPSKSMLETIDTSKLPSKVDLVLIGAGIGSANIINQLKGLNALCIDAGHALDCYSVPSLREERVCLMPDEMIG